MKTLDSRFLGNNKSAFFGGVSRFKGGLLLYLFYLLSVKQRHDEKHNKMTVPQRGDGIKSLG